MKPELAHELLARTEVNPEVTEKKKIKRMIFKNAGNCFNPQYTKTLRHHHGCVNAISVSKNGQYLLSGGDDCNVLVKCY